MKAPDLQEWIARYGGYTKIDWKAWDAVEAWQADRRDEYARLRNKEAEARQRPGHDADQPDEPSSGDPT